MELKWWNIRGRDVYSDFNTKKFIPIQKYRMGCWNQNTKLIKQTSISIGMGMRIGRMAKPNDLVARFSPLI